jgi:hypothetical protein
MSAAKSKSPYGTLSDVEAEEVEWFCPLYQDSLLMTHGPNRACRWT